MCESDPEKPLSLECSPALLPLKLASRQPNSKTRQEAEWSGGEEDEECEWPGLYFCLYETSLHQVLFNSVSV